MIHFLRILIFCSVFQLTAHLLHAQDPGTVIDVKLMNGPEKISGEELKKYSVSVGEVIDDNVLPRGRCEFTYQDSAQFRYFAWDPYDSALVYELDIVNGSDTMKVRFCGYEERWNAYFFLEIPFKKGYYEVTDFTKTRSCFYEGKHDWIEVEPTESKLTGSR